MAGNRNEQELDDEDRSEVAACAKALWDPVYRSVMGLTLGDHALSQDVTQLAFTVAMIQWPRLRCLSDSGREAWLKRVAAHKAIDEFRRNGTAREYREAMWERSQPHNPDTHRDAMAVAAVECFWKTVERLPPQAHHVAWMRWGLDMSHREIAEALGIAEKTVSSHISRTRARLRAELAKYWPIDGNASEGGASS